MIWLALALVAAPDNLVADGDFERPGLVLGRGVEPGGWKVLAPTAAATEAITLAPGEGFGGGRCAVYRRTGEDSLNIHLDQVLEVVPETIYEVTARIRGDGRLAPLLTIAALDWAQLARVVCPPSADWRTVRLVFASQGHRQVRLEWFGGARGELYQGFAGQSWLDDVVVRPLPDSPAALRQAFELTRPQPARRELAGVSRGPVGQPLPLRPIRCRDGVLVWDDGSEVALWGLNIQTALSWEWRGRLQPLGIPQTAAALNELFDRNADHFPTLGVGVVRAHLLPGDFTDGEGKLVDTPYLDALDHMLAECGRRGIYVYLTLLNEMSGQYLADSFMVGQDRATWLFDDRFGDCVERYIGALLRHVNRYTGRPLAAEPALGLIELINEPRYLDHAGLTAPTCPPELPRAFATWLQERGLAEAPEAAFAAWRHDRVLAWLRRMHAAVRAAGAVQPVVWNCNWPRFIAGQEDIFQAVAESPVEAVSVCCYPGQADVKSPFWANPADLNGRNYLPYLQTCHDNYGYLGWLLTERFADKAKCVYEFETMYQQHRYLYPALARLFRAFGVQVAPMWEYTLSPVAEYHSGSHYLNLECTPTKAVSFRIAAEVFRTTPRLTPFELPAPDRLAGPGWRVDQRADYAEYQSRELVAYTAGERFQPTGELPRRIVGCGASPLVDWAGTGAYDILLTDDTLELWLGPDATPLRPLWQRPTREPQLSCRLDREVVRPLTLNLPGWTAPARVERRTDTGWTATPVTGPGLRFEAQPGRYRVRRGE